MRAADRFLEGAGDVIVGDLAHRTTIISATIGMDHTDFESSPDAYQVKLDTFEGPLDLLLHLIRKSEVNIYDIPIALITEQYLGYLELMQEMNLDVAGGFLVMAATLIHIKSRTPP